MIPVLLDRVHLKGRPGVFLVIRVNSGAETVSLVPCTGGLTIEESIPFAMLARDGLRRCGNRVTSVDLIRDSGQ